MKSYTGYFDIVLKNQQYVDTAKKLTKRNEVLQSKALKEEKQKGAIGRRIGKAGDNYNN